jgi:molecular chaperone GrpE
MDDQNKQLNNDDVQDTQTDGEVSQVDNDLVVQQLQQEKLELETKWKRAVADYQNLERQVQREKAEFMKFASAMLCGKFLEVLDHLEQAVGGMSDEDKKSGWAVGVVMTMKQFRDLLKDEGITEISVDGKDFDAFVMEAVDRVEGEENKVVKVLKKGYQMMDGKVLRPAQVLVGKGR